MIKDLKITISDRERDLILKYGYPFPEIETQLDVGGDYPKAKELVTSSFWWEQLAGDLARSLNHNQVKNEVDYDDVEELFLKIENHLQL